MCHSDTSFCDTINLSRLPAYALRPTQRTDPSRAMIPYSENLSGQGYFLLRRNCIGIASDPLTSAKTHNPRPHKRQTTLEPGSHNLDSSEATWPEPSTIYPPESSILVPAYAMLHGHLLPSAAPTSFRYAPFVRGYPIVPVLIQETNTSRRTSSYHRPTCQPTLPVVPAITSL